MRRALVMLVVTVACATSSAGAAVYALPLEKATRIAEKVRHRELRNAFHLRQRIGGAFHLGAAYCEPANVPRRVLCRYDATQLGIDASGMRTFCTIDVMVTRHGLRRTTWHRSIAVCATDYRPAPPAR
jgi:hypothetical protein